MMHPYRRAALWAAIIAFSAALGGYIPAQYASRHHITSDFNMPLDYRLLGRVTEILAVPCALFAYGVLWVLFWFRDAFDDIWIALVRAVHATGGVQDARFNGGVSVFSFGLSTWQAAPIIWFFYFALFSVLFRLSRRKA
jgi:hypothetical protein